MLHYCMVSVVAQPIRLSTDYCLSRLLSRICMLRPVYSDATQLSPTIGNATDPVEQRTANQHEAGQSCICLPFAFQSYGKCVFHNSINLSSISSLQNSISRQTRQNTSYMTSWPANWVNWVTTYRTDRWPLFTLWVWTCRQLDVELSWFVSL